MPGPVSVQAFADQATQGEALAGALGVPFAQVALHRFPDGEALPTVTQIGGADTGGTVIAHVSLDHPDARLITLLLACDAWRRSGVQRLVLVAPYLCYLRQDRVFAPGQSLSRDVIGKLLGERFDRIVTVDAHLHRTRSLAEMFGTTPAQDLSAALPLARALDAMALQPGLVMGPDEESRPWATRIAGALGAGLIIGRKDRNGDREVSIDAGSLAQAKGRAVVLVDDICSSGATLVQAAVQLRAAGAASVDVGVVHALFDAEAEVRLRAAGVRRIVSTSSVTHPTNAVDLSGLLAEALKDEIDR